MFNLAVCAAMVFRDLPTEERLGIPQLNLHGTGLEAWAAGDDELALDRFRSALADRAASPRHGGI